MPDLTYAERLDAEAELGFARWIAGNAGWFFNTPHALGDEDRQIANAWIAAKLLRHTMKDGRPVLELTDAGRAWCREHGAA
ncbi:hypothetical protein ABT369_39640 [Dactylosporangium sp. NPDC000244]|uniref:hypothetical protein n=1 Tax=Dactylosporangium sp. NPDC000244 TaxID=3154365 RepID=UPI00332589A5